MIVLVIGRMRWYLFWSGGLLIAIVLVMVLAAQLYPKAVACERFNEEYFTGMAPEATMTPVAPDWFIQADCHGVQNDLYAAYFFIAIGIALVGGGFVLRRGE